MIYLDNAATSCPKPPRVVEAVRTALEEVCANPGRGAYETALEAGRTVLNARRAVARLIGARDDSRIVFTLNATHAINMALNGLLAPDSHVVTSSIEHNAVMRPLHALAEERGISVTRVPCAPDGTTSADDIMSAVREDTSLVVLLHASNVLGTMLPVADVGPRLRERNVPFMVDAAQTAGVFDLDVEQMAIDLLAVPGHKGLLGPQGVGCLYVGERVTPDHFVRGGTGSASESLEHPSDLPDRLEAGTPNTPGLAGLAAGVEVVLKWGLDTIRDRETALTDDLKNGLRETEGVSVFGPPPGTVTAPVVSASISGMTSAEAAFILHRAFDIGVRAGLHCSPEAHRVAGTSEEGLVRFSVGHETTASDVRAAVEAVSQIAAKKLARRSVR